jgi:hypothetical protein
LDSLDSDRQAVEKGTSMPEDMTFDEDRNINDELVVQEMQGTRQVIKIDSERS